MSSPVVRNWFREQVQIRLPSIPYFDTVNTVPNTKDLPDLWITLEFQPASEERLSLGVRAMYRESGVVEVIVLGLSGRTDEHVVLAGDQVRNAFMAVNAQVAIGTEVAILRIDAPEPPNTDATESGNWFLASVSCAYALDFMRGPV